MRRSKYVLAAWIGVLAASGRAEATSLTPLTGGDLVDRADLIVTGTTTGLAAHPDVQRALTVVSIEIDDVLKGAVADVASVLVPGRARPFGISSVVPGAPTFVYGERVVVFLDARDDGYYGVVGLVQGKFAIATDARGAEHVMPGVAPPAPLSAAQAASLPSLADFEDAVRARVGGAR